MCGFLNSWLEQRSDFGQNIAYFMPEEQLTPQRSLLNYPLMSLSLIFV